MITIYGSPRTSSGRCYWTLEEIGIEYQEKSINFKEKEHLSPEFLKLNPNGKIPALVDGDFTIWESMAINMYLCEKYKPELLGNSPEAKGLAYQWTFWANGDLQTPLIEIFIQLKFVPEPKRDQSIIDKNKAKLPELFEMLDKNLQSSKYLAGEEFTLADLNSMSVVLITEAIDYDLAKYQNITKWISSIKDRGAYQRYQALRG